jgi:PTS system mannose-specific IIC component
MFFGIDLMALFPPLLLVVLGGGLVALDRTAVFQGLVSRPLVAATVSGFLAGDWRLGLLVGAVLELYCIYEIPVGTTIPTDDTLLALAAGGIAALTRSLPLAQGIDSRSLALLAILVVLPWSEFTRRLDGWARGWNRELVDEAETALLAGRCFSAVNFHLKGLFHFYLAAVCGLVLMVTVSLAGNLLLVSLFPVWFEPYAGRLLLLFPLAGIAGLLTNMNKKRLYTVFAGASLWLFLV